MENEHVSASVNCHGKHLWLKGLVVIVVGVIVVVALLRERIINDNQNTISVTGHGKISYEPNTATVTLGAEINNAATSQQALDELNKKVAQIIAAIVDKGIAREDISTQTYTLNPHYDYANGKSLVSGYDASQQITVKVKDPGSNQQKVSDVLTSAGSAGSNSIQNVSYAAADTNELMQQAKIAAINDARQKVQALAQAAGVKLGKVVGWQEHQADGAYRPMAASSFSAASEKTIAPADVPAGTKDVEVDVDVKFEVK